MGADPNGQVCAAGALLNLLGAELDSSGPEGVGMDRAAFKKLLADCIVLGAAAQCVAEE